MSQRRLKGPFHNPDWSQLQSSPLANDLRDRRANVAVLLKCPDMCFSMSITGFWLVSKKLIFSANILQGEHNVVCNTNAKHGCSLP